MPGRVANGFLAITARMISGSANNNVGAKAESSLDFVLDPLSESIEVSVLGLEDHVAALDKSLRLPQSQRLIERFERLHFDLVVAANVDAPEHGYNHRHIAHQLSTQIRRLGNAEERKQVAHL